MVTGTIHTMIENQKGEWMDNNLSMSDITKSPNSFLVKDNNISGNDDGNGEGDYVHFLSTQEANSSQCSINITLFHAYIKSKNSFNVKLLKIVCMQYHNIYIYTCIYIYIYI